MMHPSAPPGGNVYALAVWKSALASSRGTADGFGVFREAFPDPALHCETMPFVSALHYARTNADAYVELDPGGVDFSIEPPRIVGANDSSTFRGRSRTFFAARLCDVVVRAQSAVATTGGVALFDIEPDERTRGTFRFELDPAIFSVDGNSANVITPVIAPSFELAEAFVSLVNPQSAGFGHWMWHQLPRLIAALRSGALPEVPILVDRDMPQSHFDALTLAIGDRRMPVIRVTPGSAIRVARAWYVCAPFFVPSLPFNDAGWTWEHLATPPERYAPILQSMEESTRTIERDGRGKRIYLGRRPNFHRRIMNVDEIEAVVRGHGFEIVFPEELTFAEQLAVVRDARYVAGPEGSAMFLTFYSRPDTNLFILDHPATALTTIETAPQRGRGMDVTLMTGPVVNSNDTQGYPYFGYTNFADYTIDAAAFAERLAAWTAETN